MYGPDRLQEDLTDLGHEDVAIVEAGGKHFAVIPDFEVLSGQFADRVIDLAIPAPDNYPQRIGNSIHVRADPQLFDYEDSKRDERNIKESPLGDEWRYWSHRFDATGENATRKLMSKINGVFHHA